MNLKSLIFVLLTVSLSMNLYSQSGISCKYYNIKSTGAKAFLPAGFDLQFDVTDSEDGSKVFTGEIVKGKMTYSVIFVEMKDTYLSTTDEKYDLLTSYLDFLQLQFKIEDTKGYSKGFILNNDESTVGVRDTWTDDNDVFYEVGGWINSSELVVIINSSSDIVSITNFNTMWKGFQFP